MNFENLKADLDTQPITGFDHYGNYISLPLISHIVDNLYVGGHDRHANLGSFFTHVFSFYVFEDNYKTDPGVIHEGWHMYDSHDVDVETLNRAVPVIIQALNEGGNVLVHCQAGINRSNLAATQVLREWKGLTSREAIDMLREKRGQVVLSNPKFANYLRNLDA